MLVYVCGTMYVVGGYLNANVIKPYVGVCVYGICMLWIWIGKHLNYVRMCVRLINLIGKIIKKSPLKDEKIHLTGVREGECVGNYDVCGAPYSGYDLSQT